MNHKERLTTVARVVTERGMEYGDMIETHKRIARLFNDMSPDVKLEAHHIAQVLMATKLARLYANPTHSDSVTDMIAYGAFYGELVGNGAPAVTIRKPFDLKARDLDGLLAEISEVSE